MNDSSHRKPIHELYRRRDEGFTLIEIMVVVVIIGLLAAIASHNISRHIDKTRINATMANIQILLGGVAMYELELGNVPTGLEELVVEGDEDWPGPFLNQETLPKDGWNEDFRYFLKGKRIKIQSAGKDRIFDTQDDLFNE
jgi:general secretion pathway protein G